MEFDLDTLQLLPADETGLNSAVLCTATCGISSTGMTCTWTSTTDA